MNYDKEVQKCDRGKAFEFCAICSIYTIYESYHLNTLVPMSDVIKGFVTKTYSNITLIFHFIILVVLVGKDLYLAFLWSVTS